MNKMIIENVPIEFEYHNKKLNITYSTHQRIPRDLHFLAYVKKILVSKYSPSEVEYEIEKIIDSLFPAGTLNEYFKSIYNDIVNKFDEKALDNAVKNYWYSKYVVDNSITIKYFPKLGIYEFEKCIVNELYCDNDDEFINKYFEPEYSSKLQKKFKSDYIKLIEFSPYDNDSNFQKDLIICDIEIEKFGEINIFLKRGPNNSRIRLSDKSLSYIFQEKMENLYKCHYNADGNIVPCFNKNRIYDNNQIDTDKYDWELIIDDNKIEKIYEKFKNNKYCFSTNNAFYEFKNEKYDPKLIEYVVLEIDNKWNLELLGQRYIDIEVEKDITLIKNIFKLINKNNLIKNMNEKFTNSLLKNMFDLSLNEEAVILIEKYIKQTKNNASDNIVKLFIDKAVEEEEIRKHIKYEMIDSLSKLSNWISNDYMLKIYFLNPNYFNNNLDFLLKLPEEKLNNEHKKIVDEYHKQIENIINEINQLIGAITNSGIREKIKQFKKTPEIIKAKKFLDKYIGHNNKSTADLSVEQLRNKYKKVLNFYNNDFKHILKIAKEK
ncbi:hypothetical protein [Mycoplasma sp. VS509_3]|uniref:hypothetical protein n=2 Tax=Mycoplasma TaxID=2093 RepID=UPI003AAD1E10